MMHGFLDNNITAVEEQLFDMVLRGKQFNINHALELAKTLILFDGQDVDAFILDAIGGKLVIQLVLPLKDKFDNNSNVYKTSHIRKLLNSDKFLSRFNKDFAKHIQETTINTEDYKTKDRFWLLSHEEVDQKIDFLKPNNNTTAFSLFEHIDMETYVQLLLKLNGKNYFGWRLRSASSYVANFSDSSSVGYVSNYGDVSYSYAYDTDYGALCPVCTIC